MKRLLFQLAAFGLCLSGAASTTRADVKLPPVLGSHMVLQREMLVPIWGTAAPGEKITVKFRDQTKTTEAEKDGKWSLKLDVLKAGGPDKLTVEGKNKIELDDVLVGEVWVGSGQSNMAGNVGSYAKADPVLAKYLEGAPYPKIRQASARGGWKEGTPADVKNFSALLFSFGLRLQQELDVPIGLLHGSAGGTPSGYWLSEEAYKADKPCQDLVVKLAPTYDLAAEKVKLEAALAKWEKDVEIAKTAKKNPPAKPVITPPPGQSKGKIGNLYEAHIRGFIPFAIRGVLWDQGESGTAIEGVDQYTLMGALIRGWRTEWNQGDFAFIYIQKPSGNGCAYEETDTTRQASKFAPLPTGVPGMGNGLYRENHIRIRNYPNTAMAESSDLGNGVHPTNKSGYGDRASRVAMGLVYGKKIEYSGPVYASNTVEGDKLRAKFTHTGQGLTFKHGEKLQGFMIAGEDKKFRWANATIDGDTVVVSHPEVKKPLAVRYAWDNNIPWANLFNKDGLPAQTFRTDDW
ncbi:MAG: sialate O-acetylesterase [Planctomycetes bacterium]|nr:sialate O-acetylesterase [Planctomycetota bacterium]